MKKQSSSLLFRKERLEMAFQKVRDNLIAEINDVFGEVNPSPQKRSLASRKILTAESDFDKITIYIDFDKLVKEHYLDNITMDFYLRVKEDFDKAGYTLFIGDDYVASMEIKYE